MTDHEKKNSNSPPEQQPEPPTTERMDRNELNELLVRAMKDEAFRQELLTNPKPLIEHELGVTLPQDVTIQTHEDTPTTLHVVLPDHQEWELSDAEGQPETRTTEERMSRNELLVRAMTDEAFRQELLTNPKPLIEHELGVTLPQDVTIQTHEDTPTTLHVVLPTLPNREGRELSDAELFELSGETMHCVPTFWKCGPTQRMACYTRGCGTEAQCVPTHTVRCEL